LQVAQAREPLAGAKHAAVLYLAGLRECSLLGAGRAAALPDLPGREGVLTPSKSRRASWRSFSERCSSIAPY